MATKTITQRIAFDGDQQIRAQLTQLAQAGAQAFHEIARAAQALGGPIRDIGTAAQRAGREFAPAAANVDSFTKSIVRAGTASAEAKGEVAGLATTAAEIGRDSQVERLGSSFDRVRDGVKGVANEVAKLPGPINEAASGIRKFIAVGLTVGGVVGLIAGIVTAAKNAASSLEDLRRAAGDFDTDDYQELVFILGQMGAKESEARQAITHFGDAADEAFKKGKAALEKLGQRFPDTEEGAKGAARAIDGLAQSFAGGKRRFDELDAALAGFKADKSADGLKAFVTALVNLRSEEKQTELATKAFGDTVGKLLVEDLRKGVTSIDAIRERFKSLGLGFSEEDIKEAKEFASALREFSAASAQGRTALGSLFLGPLTPAIRALTSLIRANRDVIREWVAFIGDKATSVLADFFRLLRGEDDKVETKSLIAFRDNVVKLGTSVDKVINGIILPAFAALSKGAEAVATFINEAFGTKLTAADLGIVAVLSTLIGGFNTLAILLAGVFTSSVPDIAAFRESIAGVEITIGELTTTVGDFLSGVWSDFLAALSGRDQDIQFDWVRDVVAFLKSMPGIILQVVLAFVLFRRAVIAIAPHINRLFGTAFTGDALIVIAVVGSITRAFSALGGILVSVAASLAIVERLFTIITRLTGVIGGLGAALALILLFPDQMRVVFDALAAAITGLVNVALEPFGVRITSLVSGMTLMTAATYGLAIALTAALIPALINLGRLFVALIVRNPIAVALILAAVAAAGLTEAWARLSGEMEKTGDEATGALKAAEGGAKSLLDQLRELTKGAGEAGKATRDITLEQERSQGRGIIDVGAAVRNLEKQFGALKNAQIDDELDHIARSFDDIDQAVDNIDINELTQKLDIGGLKVGIDGAIKSLEQFKSPELLGALQRQAESARQEFDKIAEPSKFQGLLDIIKQIGQELFGIRGAQAQGIGGVGEGIGGTNLLGLDPAAITAALEQMRSAAQAAFDAIAQGATGMWTVIAGSFQSGTANAGAVFNALLREMVAASQAASAAIAQAFSGVASAITQALGHIPIFVSTIAAEVTSAVSSMLAAIEAAAARAIAALQQVIALAREAAAAAASAGGGGGGGFAGGGYTGNIGSSRVAGVVHGGEYVEPARVVSRPGVLAFLETLRRVGDLRRAIAMFLHDADGFSMGGFVDGLNRSMGALMVPGYAAGGAVAEPIGVAAGRTRNLGELVLKSDVGETIGRVFTDEQTAQSLTRYATRSRLRSAGRRPSADS